MVRQIILGLLFSVTANAGGIMDLDELSVRVDNFLHEGRDPVIYPVPQNHRWTLQMDMSSFDTLLWRNKIISTTSPSQFESVAWNFDFGFKFTDYVEVFYSHTSTHLLDRKHSFMHRFPVEDSIALKIFIFKRDR